MAKEREAVASEFFKFKTLGTAVAGMITRYGQNMNGPLVEIAPAKCREGRKGEFKQFGSVAVGLNPDLRAKIKPTDVGSVLLIEFTDEKPTARGDMKLFRVLELDADDCRKMGLPGPAKVRDAEPPAHRDEDESDLPF